MYTHFTLNPIGMETHSELCTRDVLLCVQASVKKLIGLTFFIVTTFITQLKVFNFIRFSCARDRNRCFFYGVVWWTTLCRIGWVPTLFSQMKMPHPHGQQFIKCRFYIFHQIFGCSRKFYLHKFKLGLLSIHKKSGKRGGGTTMTASKHWNAANEFCICYDVFNVTWSMSHVIDFNILFKQLGTFRSGATANCHHPLQLCGPDIIYVEYFGLKKFSRNNRYAFRYWLDSERKVPSGCIWQSQICVVIVKFFNMLTQNNLKCWYFWRNISNRSES